MRLLFAALAVLCLFPCYARADQQWFVVSDVHLNPFDGDPDPSWYHTDSNWPLLHSTLSEMQRVDPNPAVIFITGDFLAHQWSDKVRAANSALSPGAAAQQTMQRIANAFNQTFPNAQFIIVLGNNDDPCGDYRASPGTAYLAQLAKIWAPLVNRHGAAPHFVRDFSNLGAYTAQLPLRGLRAIAMDDVYGSLLYRSCGRSAGDPSRAQLQWLAHSLESAPAGSRSVVVMHIPPGVDPSSTLLAHRFLIVPYLRADWQTDLLRTLAQHRESIAFGIAGHQHRNAFRLPSGVPMLIAQSVSPIYGNNPGFLLLQVSPNGTLHDYRQYGYDEETASWMQDLDFDRTFDAHAFTAPELAILQKRIASDQSVRAAWAAGQVNGSRHRDINASTWRVFWCAQSMFGPGYARCAGAQNRAALLPVAAGVVAALLILGVFVFGIWLARRRRAML